MADEATPETPVDDELCITLVRKTKGVKVTDESGMVHRMTLKEMTGANRDKLLNSQAKRAKMAPDGKSGQVVDFDGIQVDLIARCLYDEKDKLVEAKDIAQYPATVQSALYKACCTLNAMDDTSAEREKNS